MRDGGRGGGEKVTRVDSRVRTPAPPIKRTRNLERGAYLRADLRRILATVARCLQPGGHPLTRRSPPSRRSLPPAFVPFVLEDLRASPPHPVVDLRATNESNRVQETRSSGKIVLENDRGSSLPLKERISPSRV